MYNIQIWFCKKFINYKKENTLDIDEIRRQIHLRDEYNHSQQIVLDELFKGAYGSSLEDQLESALDDFKRRHMQIEKCLTKWNGIEKSAVFATTQLGSALQRWKQCAKLKTYKNAEEIHYREGS